MGSVFNIYQVKGTFGLRGSSFPESNSFSVKSVVIEHTKGMHGTIS